MVVCRKLVYLGVWYYEIVGRFEKISHVDDVLLCVLFGEFVLEGALLGDSRDRVDVDDRREGGPRLGAEGW